MLKKKQKGFSLLELMIVIALLSIVMAWVSDAVNTGLSIWEKTNKNTTTNFNLQRALNFCYYDLITAKYNTIVVDNSPTLYDTVKIQSPFNYTMTGAEGNLGYYIFYTVQNLDDRLCLVRQVYDASSQLEKSKILAVDIDPNLDTSKTGVNEWKQKGFAVKKVDTSNEVLLYVRVIPLNGETKDRVELETEAYVRN